MNRKVLLTSGVNQVIIILIDMAQILSKIIIFTIIISSCSLLSDEVNLAEGQAAPNFTLQDQDGTEHTLSSYRGKRIVIYFYPKDDTPGCTKEACGIRDAYDDFVDQDIVVFGISYDGAEAHQSFIKKYNLPFNLLSDSDKSISRLYGTAGTFFPMRKTFLIDESGTIKKIYSKVSVVGHGHEILRDFSISK
jgi:peroxiredoxin Q/BCP